VDIGRWLHAATRRAATLVEGISNMPRCLSRQKRGGQRAREEKGMVWLRRRLGCRAAAVGIKLARDIH